MASREELKEQKEKTGRALMLSALALCSKEGYASLSLRSVARKAGIAPTSFYRHFREIDELGAAMVDQAKDVLDECLKQARAKMTFPELKQNDSTSQLLSSIECIVRPFVNIFFTFFKENSELFHLFFQEQTGSSQTMRTAISVAMGQLNGFLAETLKRLAKSSRCNFGDPGLMAEVMMTLAGHSGKEMVAHPEDDPDKIIERTIRKLDMILLGALKKEQT